MSSGNASVRRQTGYVGARLRGSGFYLPPVRWPDGDDGRRQRALGLPRAAVPTESTTSLEMAIIASEQALERGHCSAEDVDLIITKGLTPSHIVDELDIIGPRLGHPLQRALGANRAFVFDLLDADWCAAIDAAHGFIANLGYRHALIVHAEASRFSVLPDPTSGFTLTDGAGALLVERQDDPPQPWYRSSFRSLATEEAGLRIEVLPADMERQARPRAHVRASFTPSPSFFAEARRAADAVLSIQRGRTDQRWLLVEENWFPGADLIDEHALGMGRRLRAPAEAGPLGAFALPYHAATLDDRAPAELTLVSLDLVKRRAGSRNLVVGAA